METYGAAELYQHIADYQAARRTLQRSAQSCLGFGVLAVAASFLQGLDKGFGVVFVGLGVGVALVGLVNLARPSAVGWLFDGAALLVLGLLFLAFVALDVLFLQPGPMTVVIGLLGLMQLGSAVSRFVRFPRMLQLFGSPPTPEEIAWLASTVNYVLTTPPEEAEDVIEFRVLNVEWKGRLLPEAALVIPSAATARMTGKPQFIFVAARDAVELEVLGQAQSGRALRGRLRLKDRTHQVVIAPEMVERIERWKHEPEPPADTPAPSVEEGDGGAFAEDL
jgi:hypothetical protein